MRLRGELARWAQAEAARMTELFDPNGIVTRWPARRGERTEVLDHLAAKFEPARIYREREVNETLNQWHSFRDHALLRRELFEAGRLDRDARSGTYWLKVPAES